MSATATAGTYPAVAHPPTYGVRQSFTPTKSLVADAYQAYSVYGEKPLVPKPASTLATAAVTSFQVVIADLLPHRRQRKVSPNSLRNPLQCAALTA